uniref:Uncharacterized protein n=1 Tax=Opuntia streptacantha TaxID=393608 RepID=A0A7C9ANG3_OPUST
MAVWLRRSSSSSSSSSSRYLIKQLWASNYKASNSSLLGNGGVNCLQRVLLSRLISSPVFSFPRRFESTEAAQIRIYDPPYYFSEDDDHHRDQPSDKDQVKCQCQLVQEVRIIVKNVEK